MLASPLLHQHPCEDLRDRAPLGLQLPLDGQELAHALVDQLHGLAGPKVYTVGLFERPHPEKNEPGRWEV